jgi:hypothetical protein
MSPSETVSPYEHPPRWSLKENILSRGQFAYPTGPRENAMISGTRACKEYDALPPLLP